MTPHILKQIPESPWLLRLLPPHIAALEDSCYDGGPGLAVARLHDDVCTDEFRGQHGGIAEVDGAPVPVVEAVGPPAWERSIQDRRGSLESWGCGGVDEHALVLKGALDGGANPGAGVDVSLGAQAGEGVVDIWRDTDE